MKRIPVFITLNEDNGDWDWHIDLGDLESIINCYEYFASEQAAKDHAQIVANALNMEVVGYDAAN